MADKKKVFNTFKNISFLTQFGLSVICPILGFIWLAVWIKNKFGTGDWIMMAAIILGLISAFYSAASFFSYIIRQAKKGEKEENDD